MVNKPGYGVTPSETVKTMSGLEFVQGMCDGRLAQPPICELLGFALVSCSHGLAVFEGTPGLRHYNPLGTVHGGFAATLLDSCMGCAVQTTLAPGSGFTTLEFKINLLKAMTDTTGPVRAEGRILSSGRRVATADGRLTDADGRLLATGTTTCLVLTL